VLQEVRDVARAETPTHAHLRERLVAVTLVTVVLDGLCSIATYLLERHAHGSDITSFGDALFWCSAQLTTVSSQMVNPLTTGGRILDVAMEIYSISVVATLAGSFGAFFHRRSHERSGAPSAPATP